MLEAKKTNFETCELRMGGPAWRAAEAAGHDMSLIREALRQSVVERLRMNDSALSLVMMMRQAVRNQDGGPGQTPHQTH